MAGIYIHIPFCKQACHYCDFHFSTSLKHKAPLLDALKKEIAIRKEELNGEAIETIYFGGGTPSLLSYDEIQLLISNIYNHYNVIEKAEITLEANPDDLSRDKITSLSNSAVNRLSIGIQSFYEEDLKMMNRAHNAQEASDCINDVKAAGFENISIDLIYGIPGMTEKRWMLNVEKALAFQIPHISSYALTVEPKTALAKFVEKGIIDQVDDALASQHFLSLIAKLEANEFIHYEVSNFGKTGFFSKNNTAYWQGKKYLGIGPSAHSYDGLHRSWNISNNSKYIKALAEGNLPSTKEILSKQDRYNEYVMTGLRTIWGVSLNKIKEDFGSKSLEYLLMQASRHLEAGLLEIIETSSQGIKQSQLKTTREGKFLSDGIASDLFLINLGA